MAKPFWANSWIKNLIPKIKIFYWLFIQIKISTTENLEKRGFVSPNICYLGDCVAKNANNLFLKCHYTLEIWSSLLSKMNLHWVFLNSIHDFFDQWMNPVFNKGLEKLLKFVVPHTICNVLKEWNNRLFWDQRK